MKNIWQELPKPLFIQAPMEDVTDTVFRQMLARTGRPDIFFTEFTNVDGMFTAGSVEVMGRLRFSEAERPIVAQIWGSRPENFYRGARLVRKMGFDGVDINFGCPQRDVMKKGLCAAFIENHEGAARIIKATKDGAGGLPVSVKTRIGIKKIVTGEWFGFLSTQGLAAIIIHARTVKEMSEVPAHWDELQGRTLAGSGPILIGNGDVKTRADGLAKIAQYGVDGVMIGRGMLENPWVFSVDEKYQNQEAISPQERLEMYAAHVRLHQREWGAEKHFDRLKKYARMYIKGFPGSSRARAAAVSCKNAEELLAMLKVATLQGSDPI